MLVLSERTGQYPVGRISVPSSPFFLRIQRDWNGRGPPGNFLKAGSCASRPLVCGILIEEREAITGARSEMGDGRIDDFELRTLMTQYQSADPVALDELVRKVSPPLLRYFNNSQLDRNDAEDMMQDCWLRIHRSRHTYRSSEPVMPWIYAIARHTRLDAYRKRRRLASREMLVANVPDTLHQETPESRQDEFERLISILPVSQREVLFMLKVSGMSLEEIAKATASTVGAAKQKARRAYSTLRRAWGEDSKK